MRVPINWLSEYTKLPQKLSVLTDKLTMAGHMLDKIEKVNGNIVIDLELRGNRADLVGILGIAKETSAILNTKIKRPQTAKLPATDKNSPLVEVLPEVGNLVKRYQAVKLSVEIKKSPKFIIERLQEYGIPAFNNVIDITNYVMVETGHPMHAFDLNKLTGRKLIIRMAKKGERFETIQQGTVLNLSDKDLAISDEKQVQCLNIIGGFDSRVTEKTTEIILESAVYDPGNCRRTGRSLKTLTEGGSRHEKIQDPKGVTFALERALFLLQKYANGKTASLVSDYYPKPTKTWKIDLHYDHLDSLSGLRIPPTISKNILTALGFKIVSSSKKLSTMVPTDRTDVRRPEDVIEEILRIYGYDKIPTQTLSKEIPKQVTPAYLIQESSVRSNLVSLGFSEAITLSFVKEKLWELNKHPLKASTQVISLLNPPSPDNQYLRITLLPNLYELSQKAIYQGADDLRMFEVGKIYYKEKSTYKEERRLGLVYFKKEGSFATFKSLVNSFFTNADLPQPVFSVAALTSPMNYTYELIQNKTVIGLGGEYQNVYYVEINLDSILGKEAKYVANLWPKFPPQIEDITLVIPERTHIGEVFSEIKSVSSLVKVVELKDVYKNSYTFRVYYQAPDKTLNNSEVDGIRKNILNTLKTKFGASL